MWGDLGFLSTLWLSQLCLRWGLFSSFSVEGLSHVWWSFIALECTNALLQGDSLKHVRPVQSQHTYILPCRTLQFCPEIAQVYVFVFVTFIPVLVLGYCQGWGFVAEEIEVVVLPLATRVSSFPDLSRTWLPRFSSKLQCRKGKMEHFH